MALGNIKKRNVHFGGHLNITSLMDILIIILVFLLYNVSFEDQGKRVTTSGLRLPTSSSPKQYKDAKITIAMSLNDIKINNELVMKLDRGTVSPSDMEGDKIVPLYNALSKFKDSMPAEEISNPNSSLVAFQADKRIPYKRLDPVMKTAGMAGYPYFWLTVMNIE